MTISRRDLFKILGAGIVLQSCVPGNDPVSMIDGQESIYSGFRFGEIYVTKDTGLIISSPFGTEKINLPNEVHSIIHSKELDIKVFVSKLELLSFGQIGNGPIVNIHPAPGNYFYGHGVIDEKRNVLYTTQAKITKNRDDGARTFEKGDVYVYSLPDFKIIDKFPTFGCDPHDTKIVNDELIVCNGGIDSSVTFIDLKTRKLIREFKVNVPHLSLRHIDVINDQNFVIGTLTQDPHKETPLYGLNLKHGLKLYPMPQGLDKSLMRMQLLSIIHHKGFIFATCPATSTLIVWNVMGEFIGGQKIASAASLSVSKKHDAVVVGSGFPSEKAHIIFVENGKLRVHKLNWATGHTGAHATIV